MKRVRFLFGARPVRGTLSIRRGTDRPYDRQKTLGLRECHPVRRGNNIMSNANQPETLPELLRTLERSVDLRSLARECGLSVRELRRRLSIWRREIHENPGLDLSGKVVSEQSQVDIGEKPSTRQTSKQSGKSAKEWPELPFASDVESSCSAGVRS